MSVLFQQATTKITAVRVCVSVSLSLAWVYHPSVASHAVGSSCLLCWIRFIDNGGWWMMIDSWITRQIACSNKNRMQCLTRCVFFARANWWAPLSVHRSVYASHGAGERRLPVSPVALPSPRPEDGHRVLLRRGLRPQGRLQVPHLPERRVGRSHADQLPPQPRWGHQSLKTSAYMLTWRARWLVTHNHLGSRPWKLFGKGRAHKKNT